MNKQSLFYVYVDANIGPDYFFPMTAESAQACREKVLDRELLKPGEVIKRIEPSVPYSSEGGAK